MENQERQIRILQRVQVRLPNEVLEELFILDVIQTIEDRLNLRLGTMIIPMQFESIIVDATVKVYRRKYYEGISQERIETLNVQFVENILDEYDKEIRSYIDSGVGSTNKNVVRFI